MSLGLSLIPITFVLADQFVLISHRSMIFGHRSSSLNAGGESV